MRTRHVRQRTLDDIARDLADSDARFYELFRFFNERACGGEMPSTEKIRARPLGLLARIGRRLRPAPEDFDRMSAWWL
ncbi:MAG: hypothetical protein ABSA02_14380 [Trebonia sp.]|jgi:hypothetical protein